MTRIGKLAGRPIEQHRSPNVGGKMSSVRGIVLHIAQGTYRGTISWQMNPNQRYASGGSTTTSSTWIVGRAEGEWAQMADTDIIAWCQRGGSRDWHSIELAGYAPAAPTAWQIEAAAQLLAWHHRTYGTPLQVADHPGERGLGHHSMDREWLGEEWGHDECPGAGVTAAKSAIVARAKAIMAGEDDDVKLTDTVKLVNGAGVQYTSPTTTVEGVLASTNYYVLQTRNSVLAELADAQVRDEAILAAVTGGGQAEVLAAIRAQGEQTRRQLADQAQAEAARDTELRDLVQQGQDGTLDANEVVRRIGELLVSADQGQARE